MKKVEEAGGTQTSRTEWKVNKHFLQGKADTNTPLDSPTVPPSEDPLLDGGGEGAFEVTLLYGAVWA